MLAGRMLLPPHPFHVFENREGVHYDMSSSKRYDNRMRTAAYSTFLQRVSARIPVARSREASYN
jgi:hypothetical protein